VEADVLTAKGCAHIKTMGLLANCEKYPLEGSNCRECVETVCVIYYTEEFAGMTDV
jgi:hypothetical protein